MKSSFCKKTVGLLLALLLMLTSLIPSFAAAAKPKEQNPILIVTGFSAFPLSDPADGRIVFPIKKPVILDAVKQALPFLMTLLKSPQAQEDFDAFYTSALPIVQELFEPISCNPDGSVKHPEVKLTYQYPESAGHYGVGSPEYNDAFDNPLYEEMMEAVGPDKVFIYGLDWRQDPFTIADDINSWVKHIKEVTGCEKVSIAGISMGGVMVSTYVAKYGTSDISHITMISSAFTGVAYVGELFKGNMHFEEKDLLAMIDESVGIDALSKILGSTHILNQVIALADKFLSYEKDKLYTDFVLPAFGYDLGMWSFVPNADLQEAKEYIFAHSDASAADLAVLNAKIDAYQLVQKNVAHTFKAAQRRGVNLAIISNYNLPMPPICPDSGYTGDKVIETVHTGAGATCARFGETLPESFGNGTSISPDRMIDASTCLFPEETWFIKNMEHVGFSKQENQCAFYAELMTADHQMHVGENPDHPQFMFYNRDSKILTPLDLQKGDVNRDGTVDLVDARHALRHVKAAEELTAIQREAADVTIDCAVSEEDALKIMKLYMGIQDKFDPLRDFLIQNGIPANKIPTEFPSFPNVPKDVADKLPPEIQNGLKPILSVGDQVKGQLVSAGVNAKEQLANAPKPSREEIEKKLESSPFLDHLQDAVKPKEESTEVPTEPNKAEETSTDVPATDTPSAETSATEASTEAVSATETIPSEPAA